MILLDTHIFVWWVNESPELTKKYLNIIDNNKTEGLAISAISLWEIAKLVEKGKLKLKLPVEEWLYKSVNYYNVNIIELTIDIIVKSTQLPEDFHKDPADQLIVATALSLNIPLVTADKQILNHKIVRHLI